MNINIICVGKIKENYLKLGIEEYIKRIKAYCNIKIIEVKDEGVNDNPHDSDIIKIKNIEGERILKMTKPKDYLVALDLNKKEYSSEQFAQYLDKSFMMSSTINFIIGGSYGLSDDVKNRVNDSFSLSKMTFLHQMSRLILLEQIYRGFKINRKETYHK